MHVKRQSPDMAFGGILLAGPDTPIPGKGTTFKFLNNPALDVGPNGAAFTGSDSVSQGIYQSDGTNALRVVVDHTTPLPDLSGKFTNFDTYLGISVSDGDVAFAARGSTGAQGIFVAGGGGAVATIALASDVCPAGSGNLCVLQRPSLWGNALAFVRANYASNLPVQEAILLYSGATLSTVVDLTTLIPNGSGTFDNYHAFMLYDGELAFIGSQGTDPQQMGVYRTRQGAIERIADKSTVAPGTTQPFSYFWKVAYWQDQVVFSASLGDQASIPNQGGLYRSQNGVLERLVDSSFASPSGFGNFAGFGQASIAADGLAFVGWGPTSYNPHTGVYYRDAAGNLTVIADDVNPLFGEMLTNSTDLSPQALNGHQLALAVTVKGVGTKIYLIYWPVT